jgi:maleylacetoacetate isomerase
MKLYSFFRSSAAYRARIALHLKGIPFETVPIRLTRNDQNQPAYRSLNPQGRVPALQLDDGTVIAQSLAIVDYLETTHPDPAIHPRDPALRARSLAVALTIACDTHPFNNLPVTDYLRSKLGADQPAIDAWIAHWITSGFTAVEQMIDGDGFAFGDTPTVADICIVPQVFNARRFKVDISAFPRIVRVDAQATAHPAFARAHPSNQPDAE